MFVGSSSCVNCVGAVRVAEELGPGHTIVTLLCDSGWRYLTKFYNPTYLTSLGINSPFSTVPVNKTLHFLTK